MPPAPDPIDREPWLRRRGESDVAFRAFVAYRDGARDVQAAADSVGRDVEWARAQSKRWKWEQRALALDREHDRAWLTQQTRRVTRMRERHHQLAVLQQQIAVQELNKRLNASQNNVDPTISTRDAMDLLERGVRIERLTSEVLEHVAAVVSGNGDATIGAEAPNQRSMTEVRIRIVDAKSPTDVPS